MSDERDTPDERPDRSPDPLGELAPMWPADSDDVDPEDDGSEDDGSGDGGPEDADGSDVVDSDDAEFEEEADRAYQELLERVGEAAPQPRLGATRRVMELLGDPQRAYPIVHITGTNGKTTTSRIVESILRAYGLRTGLMTSPHLVRVTERIVVDGRPIANEAFAANWRDIRPYVLMVDAELTDAGEPALTFFEALTALAFASFAEAPVDVAVIEVGMGGEWDSTNVGDGQVAVFTPISLDHTARLGGTVAEIARTKSGIIKPLARVVTAAQDGTALDELTHAAELNESPIAAEGPDFGVESRAVAVGGQVITVRGRAGTYRDLFLPLFGDHQAQNAAVAIAAVESFLGDGSQALVGDVLAEGLATATSPGRLQLVGAEPTVLVDAAHNPDGAQALAAALGGYFDLDGICLVLAVLDEKDVRGIVAPLVPISTRIHATRSSSPRAIDPEELGDLVAELAGDDAVLRFDEAAEALESAREWAAEDPRRAVVVAGSITLVGDAIALAASEGWHR